MSTPAHGDNSDTHDPFVPDYARHTDDTATTPHSTAGPVATAAYDPNAGKTDSTNPTRDAVLTAFKKKGITPRDDADVQYWVDHINNSKGGWADQGNRQYWLDRMDKEQGGVGDYEERPENGGDLIAPWTEPFSYKDWEPPDPFKPPTELTEQNDPGYKGRLALGQESLQRSAFSRGTGLTGGALRDMNDYAQTFASNEFGNVYNRELTNYNTRRAASFQDWSTNYEKALNGYQQRYNVFENNQTNAFNRLAAISGLGQTSAAQLNSNALGFANTMGGLYGQYANNMGNYITGAGNAGAAGIVGGANAWQNGLGNIANLGSMYAAYNMYPPTSTYFPQGGGRSSYGPTSTPYGPTMGYPPPGSMGDFYSGNYGSHS